MKAKPSNIATALGKVVSSAVAMFSIWLLIVGQELTTVFEGSSNETTVYSPAPIAVIPFISAVLVLIGLNKANLKLAWFGSILLTVFSFLGVFGTGSWFLIPSLLLIGLLSFLQLQAHRN